MESKVSKSQIQQELRSRWKDQAVEAALRGDWDEAVQSNLEILEIFPDDVKARNRLGNAYLELGQNEQAAETYEENLQRQPSNPIARRRLTELYALVERPLTDPLEDDNETEASEDSEDESIEKDS